jgi:hypothetical protein
LIGFKIPKSHFHFRNEAPQTLQFLSVLGIGETESVFGQFKAMSQFCFLTLISPKFGLSIVASAARKQDCNQDCGDCAYHAESIILRACTAPKGC